MHINPDQETVEEIYISRSSSPYDFTLTIDATSGNGNCDVDVSIVTDSSTLPAGLPFSGNTCSVWVLSYASNSLCYDVSITFDAGDEDPLMAVSGDLDWTWEFNGQPAVSGSLTEIGPRVTSLVYSVCYG